MISVVLTCKKCGKVTDGPEVIFEPDTISRCGPDNYDIEGSIIVVCPKCGADEEVEC